MGEDKEVDDFWQKVGEDIVKDMMYYFFFPEELPPPREPRGTHIMVQHDGHMRHVFLLEDGRVVNFHGPDHPDGWYIPNLDDVIPSDDYEYLRGCTSFDF